MIDLMSKRNIGILSAHDQAVVADAHLFILGCGMGSIIAELAVRTGFRHITLMDGDRVDATNLNRQVYVHNDIDSEKATATADRLRAIHPELRLEAIPEYFSLSDPRAGELIGNADLIIDTMDISSLDVILGLHREARSQGKTVLFPLNLGFGSVLYAFTPESATLEETMGLPEDLTLPEAKALYDNKAIFGYWLPLIEPNLPPYAGPMLMSFLDRVQEEGWCPLPQVGIASYLSAVLTVAAAVRSLTGKPLPAAPQVCRLDGWGLFDGPVSI